MVMSNFKRFIPVVIVSLFILALAAVAAFSFYQYYKTRQELLKLKTDPNAYSQTQAEEAKKIIEEVSKIFVLPQNENPTIATIIDAEKLRNTQDFFKNAQNGYKVLIYSSKAFLYDPVNKRMVDTTPIFQNPLASLGNYKFYILNGTKIPSLSQKYEEELKKAVPAVIITGNSSAKANYPNSLVVDLSGSKDKEAIQISQSLNFQVSKLPEGEIPPADSDFLLIIGSDKENILGSPSGSPSAQPTPIKTP